MPILDLTHTITSSTPCWDGRCGFTIAIDCDYDQCEGLDKFRTQTIASRAGIGTHIDSPSHCFPGQKTVDELELSTLIVDCVVIKIDASKEPNFLLMPDAISRFEKETGPLARNSLVVVSTGWAQYWNDPVKYRNDLQFPSIHEATAKLLIEKGVVGLAVDTLSPDANRDFPVHRTFLGVGRYIIENLAHAHLLPARGAKVTVLPLKLGKGTEAPARIIAQF